jgi:hypothetical protein
VPVPQRQVVNREVRFTVPFGRTITIAPTSRRSSSAKWRDPAFPRIGDGRLRKVTRATNRPADQTAPCLPTRRNQFGRDEAGRRRRGPRSQPSRGMKHPGREECSRGRKRPGERGRRRTRQDQISRRALGPVKLRIWKDPHRTKKTCFFCRTGFERANSFESRSSRLT